MTTATSEPAGYLTLKETTCRNVNGDSSVHLKGTVLSAWEVDKFIRSKIAEGSVHYRSQFEPLTEEEILEHRTKATDLEGDHYVDGQHVSPPWKDYVGLHPEEIIERLRVSKDKNEVEQARLYERGGLNRHIVVDYVAPVERPPWDGYDELNVREVLEKFEVISDEAVQEAIAYESSHRKRPAIITYEGTTTPKTEEEVA